MGLCSALYTFIYTTSCVTGIYNNSNCWVLILEHLVSIAIFKPLNGYLETITQGFAYSAIMMTAATDDTLTKFSTNWWRLYLITTLLWCVSRYAKLGKYLQGIYWFLLVLATALPMIIYACEQPATFEDIKQICKCLTSAQNLQCLNNLSTSSISALALQASFKPNVVVAESAARHWACSWRACNLCLHLINCSSPPECSKPRSAASSGKTARAV